MRFEQISEINTENALLLHIQIIGIELYKYIYNFYKHISYNYLIVTDQYIIKKWESITSVVPKKYMLSDSETLRQEPSFW